MSTLRITALGQTGYLFQYGKLRILIDPYLSDYVAHKYGSHLKRMTPSSVSPAELLNVDIILITHSHEDHCDPMTLKALLENNPNATVYGSFDCAEILTENGIDNSNFRIADNVVGISTGYDDVSISTVPSAHTRLEFDQQGHSKYLGYLLNFGGTLLYHAGDTVPHEKITEALASEKIDWAFLPVNEQNHFRTREGIIGNMSPKEALLWAEELRVRNLIPTHWDTFDPNSTYPEEVEFLYNQRDYTFGLQWLKIDDSLTVKVSTEQ